MIKLKTIFESEHRLHNEAIVSVQEYPTLQGKLKFSVTWIKNYKMILTDPMRLNYSESNPKYNTIRPIINDIHSMNMTQDSAIKIAKILESEIVEFYKFEKQFNELFNQAKEFKIDTIKTEPIKLDNIKQLNI